MKNDVLVVAAHPDDEVLGVGGTMLKHVNEGDRVHILLLGDGESARDLKGNIKKRANQANRVAEKVGAKNLFLEKLPDNQFDSLSLLQITKTVEKYLFKIKPSILYTHFANDLNIDHRLTFQAVITACRPQPDFFVRYIFSFEVLSSSEWQYKKGAQLFAPTHYNDVTRFIDKKMSLMKIYKNELRPFPHPRSLLGIKTQAQYRGMEVGLDFAEAFELVRSIKKE